jgi:ornithine cyclodeaminase
VGAIHVLTEADLRAAVGLGQEELDAIEAVYPMISRGEASMPPILRVDVPEHNGEIDVKAAYLPGEDGIAVKISAGFFDNPGKGLPSLGGLMMVLDATTGVPRAALFDNGYLTDLRTGLAGAVAARHLARQDASVVAILGAGVQARCQLEALTLVRPIETVQVWARRAEQATSFAAEMGDRLGIPIRSATDPREAVGAADIAVTTTPATTPIVSAAMLHPGLHITSVGSDAEAKQELSADAVIAADVVVCDSLVQSRRLGELRAAIDGGLDPGHVLELGQVIEGTGPGRTASEQVTVCDLTGTGAQDTAIASLAVARCIAAGAGTTLAT